jgi:hypothetical protein
VQIVLKSGSLKLLESSGPVQACNGIALTFTSGFRITIAYFVVTELHVIPRNLPVTSNHTPGLRLTDAYQLEHFSCEVGISYAKSKNNSLVPVAVFILCWSPYFVFDLLQVYGKVPETQTNIAVATFIQSLAPLNSAANPVIYCLFSTRMCNAVRYVLVDDSEDRHVIPVHQRNPSSEDNIKYMSFVES